MQNKKELTLLIKEIEEVVKSVDDCLNRIKDIDQRRCNQASSKQEIYDVAVSHWATVAQSILDKLTLLKT